MENPKEKIYSILKDLASEMGQKTVEFRVERPKDKLHGDLASNIALILDKNLKRNPLEVAKKIVEILKTKYKIFDSFDKVEAVKPGFINFYFSKEYLATQIEEIIKKANEYGSLSLRKGKKASVEFVSANPTGPLHIGNARGGPLGDVIANVLSKAGYEVTREYLHNDVGGQVNKLGEAIYFELNPQKKTKDTEVQYQGEYIQELANKVKDSILSDDLSQEEFSEKAGKIAAEILLEEILKDCEAMGIKFDKVTKESELRKQIPEVLGKIDQYLKDKDGAKWFAPNDEYLKDRETVVQKSNGEYTYFASDIVYHNQKMSDYDIVLDILGSNHSGHVPRIQAVVKILGFNPSNFKVILYQYVRLKRGGEIVKMSKRAGNFVTAKEVLDEVGKDVFRFFLLLPRAQTHMDFDLELAKQKSNENPVFYIQYAYTRICSIFAKNQESRIKNHNSTNVNLSLLKTEEEMSLIRHLTKFPYLVEEVAQNLEVNSLTTYALELAGLFHKFYETNQVVSKDEKLTKARLVLLKATQITLKNTLDLLGISAPESM